MKRFTARLNRIVFGVDTPPGKLFDVVLLVAIVTSVVLVMADSVPSINQKYHRQLILAEWIFTIIFTIEYIVRIAIARHPRAYIFSFYGLVDFISIVPTYLTLILAGGHSLMVIRTIRLLRIFRIFKLARFMGQGKFLIAALRASREKIAVFLVGVLSMVIVMGTLMYLIEGEENGFTSIPRSIYWAIVTLTTVGYGDIAPQTFLGQTLASIVMISGYAVIAVPTGIVTAEFTRASHQKGILTKCTNCGNADNDTDAKFCKACGTRLSVS